MRENDAVELACLTLYFIDLVTILVIIEVARWCSGLVLWPHSFPGRPCSGIKYNFIIIIYTFGF